MDLQPGEGLPYSLALQPQVANFIALFDGKKTLAEVADQFAAMQSADPGPGPPRMLRNYEATRRPRVDPSLTEGFFGSRTSCGSGTA